MKTITKEFAQKIIHNQGIIETATYRYIYDTENGSFPDNIYQLVAQ